MDSICEFIVKNVEQEIDQQLGHSVMSNDYTYSQDICGEIINDIKEMIEVEDIITYPENINYNRKVIVSFKYNGRRCNICEHYGTQVDYICVRLEPVV